MGATYTMEIPGLSLLLVSSFEGQNTSVKMREIECGNTAQKNIPSKIPGVCMRNKG